MQVAALSIATANGLLLKGGKEARHTNQCLYQIVCSAIETEMKGNPIALVRRLLKRNILMKIAQNLFLY